MAIIEAPIGPKQMLVDVTVGSVGVLRKNSSSARSPSRSRLIGTNLDAYVSYDDTCLRFTLYANMRNATSVAARPITLRRQRISLTMSEGYPKKLIVLVIVWTVIATYAATWIDHGWIPHDEGTLAQSAERVLSGELPHRDFDEAYTGGLSYLNALAFQLWGVNLLSLRIVLLVFFLAWVPALYYVALHFVRPVAAGAVVLLAVAWSVPNYAAPMPSWYNLFFAVFGTAALLRYSTTTSDGGCSLPVCSRGFSCLAKIVGLYFVAAVLLFLAFREQFLLRATRQPPNITRHELGQVRTPSSRSPFSYFSWRFWSISWPGGWALRSSSTSCCRQRPSPCCLSGTREPGRPGRAGSGSRH